MPNDRDKLKTTLAELHQELADVDQLDPEVNEQLRAMLTEIQTLLDAKRPGTAPGATRSSLLKRLGEATRHFEESHPALSRSLGSLADLLGPIGF